MKIDERATRDSLSLYARIHHTKEFLPKNCDVLDVGCGRGYISDMLVENGCNVTGFDYDKPSIESVKAKGDFFISDLYDFKTEKKFDCILVLEVLEHLKDDRKALEILHGWLKPDGRLIISVPTIKFNEKYTEMGHLRHYTEFSLEELLKSCKFRIQRKKEWGLIVRRLLINRNSNRTRWNGLLKKIAKPFIYIDTRLNLSNDDIIVECVKALGGGK